MNKQQFLDKFKKELNGLPGEDVQKSLDFYSEMIDDRVDEGLSEQEAVASLGNIKDIANEILMDTPLPKLVKQKIKPKHRMGATEIVLLILGSPIWLSLLVAVVAVIISVYVSLWSIIISLYAVSASLATCGVAGVLSFPIFGVMGHKMVGVFIIGCGLVCGGLSILMFMASNLATKGLLWLSRIIWLGIKKCFVKRGDGNDNC